MSRPLVSVITSFHKSARYLAQCTESVLSQSYSCLQYILSDNCSADCTQMARIATRWMLALQPQRRFFFKTQVWKAAAEITEFYRQAHRADPQQLNECRSWSARDGC